MQKDEEIIELTDEVKDNSTKTIVTILVIVALLGAAWFGITSTDDYKMMRLRTFVNRDQCTHARVVALKYWPPFKSMHNFAMQVGAQSFIEENCIERDWQTGKPLPN